MPRRDRDDDDDSGEHQKPRKKGMPTWAILLIALGAVVLVCGGGVTAIVIFAVGTWNKAVQQVEAQRTYPTMSADDLIKEWGQNSAAAAQKYKVSGVAVTGKVKEINSNLHNQTYLELGELQPSKDIFPPTCHIFVVQQQAKSDLAAVKVGDTVTVKALATGQTQNTPWLEAVSISRAK